MARFVVERILSALLSALLAATVVFFVIRLIPGDPASVIAGFDASPERVASLRSEMGLDRPVWIQYARFVSDLVTLDLGTSVRTGRPVTEELWIRFPATLELAVTGLLLALAIAIPLGSLSAVRRNSKLDHGTRITTLVGIGVPPFWLGLLLAWIFAYYLRLLPASGRLDVQLSVQSVTGFIFLDALIAGKTDAALNVLRHMVLPTVVLATPAIAILTRLMRGSLLEVLGEEYVRTARAKGLREITVIGRHALKNALNPVITLLGLQLAGLLSGSILVETIFSWPGVGSYVFNAIQTRDYPIVQGAVILIAVLYVTVNTVVDVTYGVIDPRTRSLRASSV